MNTMARLLLCVATALLASAAWAGSEESMTIKFSEATGGMVSIAPAGGGRDFIGQAGAKPLLWRLFFRDAAGKEVDVDNTQSPPPAITRTAAAVTIRWNGMDLGGDKGAFDVRVVCDQKAGADTALLRIWVRNRSRTFGLWTVRFPLIEPISRAGECDVARGDGNWGVLMKSATETYEGDYPSARTPMQFLLVQQGEEGLYLAAHDPDAWPKNFHIQPGGQFRVDTYAAGMGVPGTDWSAPYPFAIGIYRGDWMTGCKRYRAWSLRAAPWTRKGPLAKRTDVPDAIKGVCAWILSNGSAVDVVPKMREFAQKVGAPVGTHWYNWHEIPFDTHYPDYFPAKPGFADGVRELTREGIVVMPYINARLWDSANADFAAARPHATKNERGEVTIEEYGSGAKLAVMCPTQALWQQKMAEVIRRLGDEYGVNAVYMDQIGSAGPRRCFDPTHGHPLGSGPWWVGGYRKLLTPIKQWCASRATPVGLTTENDAEPYMDNVDGFLIWTPRDSDEIPMTTAVYGGYTLYFATDRAFFGAPSYCLCQARDFTWGAQMGWDGIGLLEPAHAEELACLGRLARLRHVLTDYMVYGELLEVLHAENQLPQITGTWNTHHGDRPVTLPAVHGAIWRGRDGSIAAIFANADTQPHEFTFTFDADRLGLGKAARWSIDRITTHGAEPLPPQSGRRFTLTVEVPARDGVALRLRP